MTNLTVQQAFDLALELLQSGRSEKAQQLYNDVGLALFAGGYFDQAVDAYQRAISINPAYIDALINLGNTLASTGRYDQALKAYRHVVSLNAANAEAHNNIGNVLKEMGQLDDALAAFRLALEIKPGWAGAWFNLGSTLKEAGRLDEAMAALQKCIALDANLPPAYVALGRTLKQQGHLDEAITAYRQAVAIKSDYAVAYHDLGITLLDLGHVDESITAYQRAIELNPEWAEAHHDLAQALLYRGDLPQGWMENGWRWKIKTAPAVRIFSGPQWIGEALVGKKILLIAEQGFGDCIQFIRYAPMLASLGATVIVEAPTELLTIFKSTVGVAKVVESGKPVPEYDVHCPLLTLPFIFKTTLETIPNQIPYLAPDPSFVEKWRSIITDADRNLKVAIAWAGNVDFKADRTRSLTLDRLARLSEVSGVKFYSIQKGSPAAQADHPPVELRLINLSKDIQDFADTAAVISLMDLVITTDTSVPHLAGALGKQVWLMLQFVPDWRWLIDQPDSPWYPTMRLFRQTSLGDWEGVMSRVVEALSQLTHEH